MYVILCFITLISVLELIALTIALSTEIHYCFTKSGLKYPKLRYKDFIKYYRVNPDRWILEDKIVKYKQKPKDKFDIEREIFFSIPFSDKFKYYIFKRKANPIKEKEKYDKAYKILIDNVQEDINKLRQDLDMK